MRRKPKKLKHFSVPVAAAPPVRPNLMPNPNGSGCRRVAYLAICVNDLL
jgi:hypothetical protein